MDCIKDRTGNGRDAEWTDIDEAADLRRELLDAGYADTPQLARYAVLRVCFADLMQRSEGDKDIGNAIWYAEGLTKLSAELRQLEATLSREDV